MKGVARTAALASLLVFAYGNPALAGTPVSGAITSNTSWTLAGSPYELVGDVTVQNGATLSIEAGVEVFGSGRLILLAATGANLVADGSPSSRIRFGASGSFGGLVFKSGGSFESPTGSVLDHVEIYNASVGLALDGATVPISNSVLSDNGTAISFNVISVSITNSTLTDNSSGIRGMARDQITLTQNTFWNNRTSVEILAARSCACNTARWEIHQSDFLRGPLSGQFDLTVGGNTAVTSDTYDATNNWWGTTDGSNIQARIYDGNDDGLEKIVAWSPPSSAANTPFVPPNPSPSPSPSPSPTLDPSPQPVPTMTPAPPQLTRAEARKCKSKATRAARRRCLRRERRD